MALIGTQLPGSPQGTYGIFSLPSAATFPATISFFDSQGRASGTRNCEINAIGANANGPNDRGPASPGAQLTGFTTDASGLVTTGVWKLTSPTVANYNRVTLQVPADFVAVGGGALGAETPYGALVTESYQSDTISGAEQTGDLRRWTARTSDLTYPQPHQTTVYAIGMRVAGKAARDLRGIAFGMRLTYGSGLARLGRDRFYPLAFDTRLGGLGTVCRLLGGSGGPSDR
jgi:hypothetical protein